MLKEKEHWRITLTDLTPSQEHWDNKILNYDLERFNWPAWALEVVQEVSPQVKELETLLFLD